MKNVIYERFESINTLLKTIENRPNNDIMKDDHDSEDTSKSSKEFTGTESYLDGRNLLLSGWDEPLAEIKSEIGKINYMGKGFKPRPENAIVGYIPNVPNALMNLPQSMITINRIPQKVRAINIYYSNTANCSAKQKEFIDNGVKLLKLVNRLESSGVRVNLYSVLYYAEKCNDFAFVPVKIKDFRDKLDLKKICFPIAHPSWLRRIGFKWLETAKGLQENYWKLGYGRSINDALDHEQYKKLLKERKILKDSDLFFSFYEIQSLNLEELADKILK